MNDPFLATLKSQCDAGMRVVEAIGEGSRNLREAQLKAAGDTLATATAMRKRIAQAANAQELAAIQAEWVSANVGAALAYWRQVVEITLETQSTLAGCFMAPATLTAAVPSRRHHVAPKLAGAA